MPNLTVPGLRLHPTETEQESGAKVRPAIAAAEDFKKTRLLIIHRCLWNVLSIVQPF